MAGTAIVVDWTRWVHQDHELFAERGSRCDWIR